MIMMVRPTAQIEIPKLHLCADGERQFIVDLPYLVIVHVLPVSFSAGIRKDLQQTLIGAGPILCLITGQRLNKKSCHDDLRSRVASLACWSPREAVGSVPNSS